MDRAWDSSEYQVCRALSAERVHRQRWASLLPQQGAWRPQRQERGLPSAEWCLGRDQVYHVTIVELFSPLSTIKTPSLCRKDSGGLATGGKLVTCGLDLALRYILFGLRSI